MNMSSPRATTHGNQKTTAIETAQTNGASSTLLVPVRRGNAATASSISPSQIIKESENEDALFEAIEALILHYMSRPNRYAPVRTRFRSTTDLGPDLSYSISVSIHEHPPSFSK